jgi:hypothetical protein
MCVEKCCSSARLYKQKAERMRRAYSLLFVVVVVVVVVVVLNAQKQKKQKNFGLYMDFYFFSHVYRRACAGLLRCGKSCRLRWTNYLRPDIKRGRFSLEEEQMIIHLHAILGNR